MATGTLTLRYAGPGLTREWAISETGTAGSVLIDAETVANATTDGVIAMPLDVSAVKLFWIESDRNVTIETNNGSSPADTLSLIAGEPYVWHSSSLDAFLLGTDVTNIYVTNTSGATATLYAGVVYDATPS